MADKPLPEGTDSIIDDNGVETGETGGDDTLRAGTNTPSSAGEALTDDDLMIGDDTALGAEQAGAGAGTTGTDADPGDLRAAFMGRFEDLRGQATDRAFAFAQSGKDRATSALDDLVRTVEDAAEEIDAKVGRQYGDYARRAAQTLGGFSDSFKAKEVDDLFADARELVKKSPGVAIGAAAALGFVVARLVKAGMAESAAGTSATPDDSPQDDRTA